MVSVVASLDALLKKLVVFKKVGDIKKAAKAAFLI